MSIFALGRYWGQLEPAAVACGAKAKGVRRWKARLALAFVLVLAAGCVAGPTFQGFDATGCQATSRGNESLSICSAGCSADNGVGCSGTCTAQWVVNGTTVFHQANSCNGWDRLDQVLPLATGGSIHWALEPADGSGVRCRLTVSEPDSASWQLAADCLTEHWGRGAA